MTSAATFAENTAAAEIHLRRFTEGTLAHLIGGDAVASVSGETFDNVTPIDGSHLGQVAAGDAADIDAAAKAATEAFGVWGGDSGLFEGYSCQR